MKKAVSTPVPKMPGREPERDAPPPAGYLRALNIFGLDHLEPVLLAALTDEQPLLLIGAHGTAKSALLNRIAAALALEHRHYNASLISFDDLLGYPIPNAERTGLTYLRTDGDLWNAESVFLDEISRCRPEVQNKLFAIVHEKRVQGLPLTRLRFRWAAMNPPATESWDPANDGDDTYAGSLPLDVALADRFPYVLAVPQLRDLPRDDRLALITTGGDDPTPEATRALVQVIGATRAALTDRDHALETWAAEYVEALIEPLREAGFAISGRRAGYLCRNIRSIRAAADSAGSVRDASDCAFLALKWGLPQRAQGKAIDEAKLIAIHEAALQLAGELASSPWHQLRRIADPVQRLAQAMAFPAGTIGKIALSALLTDVWAGLSVPQRYILARHLFPRLTKEAVVNLPALELVAEPVQKVWDFCHQEQFASDATRPQVDQWNALLARVTVLERKGANGAELANVLLALRFIASETFDPDALIALDAEYGRLFAPPLPERIAA